MRKQSSDNYILLKIMTHVPYSFKELYGQLKDMKTEIEHVQHLLEKVKVQMQKDFEIWWKQQADKVINIICAVKLCPFLMRVTKLSLSRLQRNMIVPTDMAHIFRDQ